MFVGESVGGYLADSTALIADADGHVPRRRCVRNRAVWRPASASAEGERVFTTNDVLAKLGVIVGGLQVTRHRQLLA